MPSATRSLRTAVAVLCALALAGCSSGSSGADAQTTYAPQHRKAAPDLAGATLKGGTFSLAAERGHVVVVNFWASWCDPCRDEADTLDQVATDLQPAVTFIGIAFHGDVKANALAFLRSHDVPYDSLYDPDSHFVVALAGKVSVSAPPLTMIIDKQGRIATVINGEVDYTHFKAAVVAANAEAAA